MGRLWIVARHEFLTNLRKRSFLFAVFGLPLLLLGIFAVVGFATSLAFSSSDITGENVGYVDEIGVLSLALEKPEGFNPIADAETASASLEAGEIEGYFIVGDAYVNTGNIPFYAKGAVSDELEDIISAFVVRNVVSQTNSTLPEDLLENPARMTVFLENTGRMVSRDAFVVLFIIPLVFVMLFMMALQFSSGFLMSSVVEEKSNRIMELLITSVTPAQLLGGKIIGLGGLGLVQIGAWVLFSVVGFFLFQNTEVLQGVVLPVDLIVVAALYFFLNFFLYGSLMAGIGAVVDSEQESRQIAGILSLALVLPLFFLTQFFTDPDTNPIVLFLSYFPFSSGLAMLLRMTFGVVGIGELALSLGISLATTIFITWASAKVFRWGLLLYGKKITLRELWRVIRGKSDMSFTAPQSAEAK